MGKDLCKPCENYCKLEDTSISELKQNNNNNDLENEMSDSSKLLFYAVKKKTLNLSNSQQSKFRNVNNKLNKINSNNDNIKTSVSKNEDNVSLQQQKVEKVVVNENDLNKIIYKYRINLLISSFRKFKKMKEDAHNIIQLVKNLKEKKYLILVEGNEELDVDLFPEESYDYLGNIFNNKKDGFGIQYFPSSNSIYIGYFFNDKRINVCKFEDKSRLYTYKGEIDNNFTGRYGIYNNYGKKLQYEGEFKSNCRDGIGEERYKDGSIYQGEFKNGLKHGIGTYFWKDESKYEGEWKNNLIEGYGIYKFKDGSFCSGFWCSNQLNGFGKFTYPDIKYYLGFFKKDCKSGFGLIFWIKERKSFVGYWKNNKQNGYGKFMRDGSIRYGLWKEGKKVYEYENNIFYNLLKENNISSAYIDIFKMDYDELSEFIKKFEDL